MLWKGYLGILKLKLKSQKWSSSSGWSNDWIITVNIEKNAYFIENETLYRLILLANDYQVCIPWQLQHYMYIKIEYYKDNKYNL